jgi:hypothetical protein
VVDAPASSYPGPLGDVEAPPGASGTKRAAQGVQATGILHP